MVTFKQCPQCKQIGRDLHKDNLAVYDDGHVHCFACGYHKSAPNSIANMKKKLYQYKQSSPDSVDILEDVVYNIPPEPLQWLRKYNVTNDDILKHNIAWNPNKSLLVLPIYDGDKLVSYQGRYFGTNPDYPKYVTKLYRQGYWKLFVRNNTNTFILVEDFVSALRVGHSFNAIPLLGTNCPIELLIQLVPQNPRLVVWLDRDKAVEAMKISSRARQFYPAYTLVTPKDPKCYTNNEIREFVDVLIPNGIESFSEQGIV